MNAYKQVNDTARKTTCAMITAMDDALAEAVRGYESAGIWDDTVVVVSVCLHASACVLLSACPLVSTHPGIRLL